MKNIKLWIVVIFSAIGIIGSLIATYQYFQILQTGFEEKSFCTINEFINCDVAYASSHAKFFGIPASWLGFIFYLWMVTLTLWILFKKSFEMEMASVAWIASLLALCGSIYKAYTSLFILKVLCLICASIYVVNLSLFFLWHGYLKIGIRNWNHLQLKFKPSSFFISTFLFFAVGWIGISGYQKRYTKEYQIDVPIHEIVRFHFRQSQYQFEVNPQAPVWGNPNAKVTVVEFSDFQCPFCKDAAFHLKPVLSEFRSNIRFYFYHYPLDSNCNEHAPSGMHDKACLAAQASVCVKKSGKDFWSYHDDLFRNQKKLGRELFIELARKMGFEENQFTQCLEAEETIASVKENIEAGQKIFVGGTPTILVNNRRVKYWTNPEVLRAILKEEIRRSQNASQ